jgi:ketosteroid isomerase-like protein
VTRSKLGAWLVAVIALAVSAQARADEVEQKIRRLDASEARAMLGADLAALARLWSDRLVVNAPDNTVKPKEQVLQAVREGRIRYSTFERTVERVVADGDVVVSMGGEVVVPVGDRPDAGQRLSRRYSHVWQRTGDSWALIARHANVVPQAPR